MPTTTPPIIKPSILEFCSSIVPHQQPLYVEVNPLRDQTVNECFTILPKHVTTHGGEQVFGWSIWEWPKVMIEAEFHAVWRTKDSRLIDVTPKQISISRILFLPDPSRKYEGVQVDNIRKPLRGDKRIYRFCELAHELFLATNEGNLAYKRTYDVTPKIQKIRDDMMQLYMAITRKYGE